MNEEFKNIIGINGYKISNYGNVLSLKRKVPHKLVPFADADGYLHVCLFENNKVVRKSIHRLVAEHFIDNPNNYNYVNHKDECVTNNNVENLEWCCNSYNLLYRNAQNKRLQSCINNNTSNACKQIASYDDNMKLIKIYKSIHDAARDVYGKQSAISRCLSGKRKHHRGLVWKYLS